MQIVDDKLLVVRTKWPSRITETIKRSKAVAQHGDVSEVVVFWGLEEAQNLSKVGIKKVPSPILRDYDWPGFVCADGTSERYCIVLVHQPTGVLFQ